MKFPIPAFLTACALCAGAHATVLTFTSTQFPADNTIIAQSYGDFITGGSGSPGDSYGTAGGSTSNIAVSYEDTSNTLTALKYWGSGYGNLAGVAWSSLGHFQVRLQGDSSWNVTLTSVDLAPWANISGSASVVVRDGNGTQLFSQSGVSLLTNQTTTVNFGGISAQTLIVSFQNGAGIGLDQYGIDNLTFGQVSAVPEPGTWGALAGGMAFAGTMIWRRRRHG